MKKSPTQDNLKDPSSTLGTILTGGHLPIVDIGLVPFTPSKQYDVACLEDVQFDPKMKSIVWRTEKTMKMGEQPPVTTITKRIVVKNVEDNTKKMASMGIATAYENAHNIDKLTETLEQFK